MPPPTLSSCYLPWPELSHLPTHKAPALTKPRDQNDGICSIVDSTYILICKYTPDLVRTCITQYRVLKGLAAEHIAVLRESVFVDRLASGGGNAARCGFDPDNGSTAEL